MRGDQCTSAFREEVASIMFTLGDTLGAGDESRYALAEEFALSEATRVLFDATRRAGSDPVRVGHIIAAIHEGDPMRSEKLQRFCEFHGDIRGDDATDASDPDSLVRTCERDITSGESPAAQRVGAHPTDSVPSPGGGKRRRSSSEAGQSTAAGRASPSRGSSLGRGTGVSVGALSAADTFTRSMTSSQYREYATARSSGTFAHRKVPKFRAWLRAGCAAGIARGEVAAAVPRGKGGGDGGDDHPVGGADATAADGPSGRDRSLAIAACKEAPALAMDALAHVAWDAVARVTQTALRLRIAESEILGDPADALEDPVWISAAAGVPKVVADGLPQDAGGEAVWDPSRRKPLTPGNVLDACNLLSRASEERGHPRGR